MRKLEFTNAKDLPKAKLPLGIDLQIFIILFLVCLPQIPKEHPVPLPSVNIQESLGAGCLSSILSASPSQLLLTSSGDPGSSPGIPFDSSQSSSRLTDSPLLRNLSWLYPSLPSQLPPLTLVQVWLPSRGTHLLRRRAGDSHIFPLQFLLQSCATTAVISPNHSSNLVTPYLSNLQRLPLPVLQPRFPGNKLPQKDNADSGVQFITPAGPRQSLLLAKDPNQHLWKLFIPHVYVSEPTTPNSLRLTKEG